MSLRPQTVPSVPEQTVRIARAAFPKGNLYLQIRDQIGVLFQDSDFADLFPNRGQPAYAPCRLALITIFQFIEKLSDREASDAVRASIDWKYALSLDLESSGFDSTVLCEFRARLVAGRAENLLFDKLLDWCREQKMLKARGRQRTDSTHILAVVRGINRLECVLEAIRNALNSNLVRMLPTRSSRNLTYRFASFDFAISFGNCLNVKKIWLTFIYRSFARRESSLPVCGRER